MRLNPDCIRDLILSIEENIDNDPKIFNYESKNNYPRLLSYKYDVIEYHLDQCYMDGLIKPIEKPVGKAYLKFNKLTPKGHEFAEAIHNDTTWNKVKETSTSIGSFAINILTQVATGIITNQANKFLGM